MVTLIGLETSDGDSDVCDARCYNAKHPRCVCRICGGENHAVGLEQALANTRKHGEAWIEKLRADGLNLTGIERAPETLMTPLF